MGMTHDKMISRDHMIFWFVKQLADIANNHTICLAIYTAGQEN